MRKRILWLTAVVLAGIPLGLTLLWQSGMPKAVNYPIDNGYDDFIAAAALTIRAAHEPTNIVGWRTVYLTNQPALDRMRAGLEKTCLSSNTYDGAGMKVVMDRMGKFKLLALAQRAEFEVALADGDTNAAVRSAITGLRFGNDLARGGVIMEALVGRAVRSVALTPLLPIITNLSLTNAIFALEHSLIIASNAPPARENLVRESAVRHQFSGLKGYVLHLVGFGRSTIVRVEQDFEITQNASMNDLGELCGRFGKRVYELENGKPAGSWKDLVPRYLPEIPKDIITGSDLPFP